MTSAPWRVTVAPSARRQLWRLPQKAAGAIIVTFDAIAADTRRIDKPLGRDLAGHYVVRRGPYRIIYRLDDQQGMVEIAALAHRSDVYHRH